MNNIVQLYQSVVNLHVPLLQVVVILGCSVNGWTDLGGAPELATLFSKNSHEAIDICPDDYIVILNLLERLKQVLDAHKSVAISIKQMEAEAELLERRPIKYTIDLAIKLTEAEDVSSFLEKVCEQFLLYVVLSVTILQMLVKFFARYRHECKVGVAKLSS